MPLRSNGCYKCRSRKIRCDLARPGCQRCVTHGVKCPGYRTERPGDIEFRDQTGLVWQRANDDEVPGAALSKSRRHSQNATPGSSSSEDSTAVAYPLGKLQSPPANRAQLYETFMQFYLPRNFLAEELHMKDTHFGWLQTVASMAPSQPALMNALDAISLVQLGTILDDKRLLRAAVESYTLGLRSLARALSNPNNVYNDEILAASSILCQCEIFNAIKQHGKGWLGHLQGLQKIITARGPQALESRLSRMLFYQSARTSVASSMLLRKKAYYSAPQWLAAQERVDLREDYSESYRSGQQLPGLLERADNISLAHSNARADVDDLLFDCEMLRLNMRREVATLSSQTIRNGKSCFVLADVGTFSAFHTLVQDRTLDVAYRFTSYMTSYLYSQYWLRMFLLRSCMQKVHTLRQQLVPGWLPESEQSVNETELLGYVMNLCRCIPYMVEPSNGAIGTICTFFPVHVATQYFQSRKHWQWLKWIYSVRDGIFTKGLSIPLAESERPSFDSSNGMGLSGQEWSFNGIDETSEGMPYGPYRDPSEGLKGVWSPPLVDPSTSERRS